MNNPTKRSAWRIPFRHDEHFMFISPTVWLPSLRRYDLRKPVKNAELAFMTTGIAMRLSTRLPLPPQEFLLLRHLGGGGAVNDEDGAQGAVFLGESDGSRHFHPAVVREHGWLRPELQDDGYGA